MITQRYYHSEVFVALNDTLAEFCKERGNNDPIETKILMLRCAITQIFSGANMLCIMAGRGVLDTNDPIFDKIDTFIKGIIDERNLPMSL